MQTTLLITALLIAGAHAAPAKPADAVAPAPAPVSSQSAQQVSPSQVAQSPAAPSSSPVAPSSSPVAPSQVAPSSSPVAPSQVAPSSSPVAPSQVAPSSSPVAPSQVAPSSSPVAPAPVAIIELHQAQASNNLPYSVAPAGYYQPAGVVTVVNEQQSPVKPAAVVASSPASPAVSVAAQQAVVRNFEQQYGQPESAALPANYKPFGSWGLYIGGNPADGYYTNYYKALSASVNEQKDQQKQLAQQPLLKASGPINSDAYYPYAYAQGDFATVYNQHPAIQTVSSHFGSPQYQEVPAASYEPIPNLDSAYSSRKGVAPVAPQAVQVMQKELVKGDTTKAYYQPPQPQSRVYVYSPPVASHVTSPVATRAQVQEQQQQQVVAYPVPVGSQIVGSQAGVDGSFYPYGVHAYTRYVVKPTLVTGAAAQEHASAVAPGPAPVSTMAPAAVAPQQSAVAAAPAASPVEAMYQQPSAVQQGQVSSVVYQSQQQPQYAHRVYYQPYYNHQGYYYGYPSSQLHYSKAPQHYSSVPEQFKPEVDYSPFNAMMKPVPASPMENKPLMEEAARAYNEAALNERRA